MNIHASIKKLWNYLKIQDEVLIVQVYNEQTNDVEYIMAEMDEGELSISIVDKFDQEAFKKPYRLIKQRGAQGTFEIPLVEQLENDRIADY